MLKSPVENLLAFEEEICVVNLGVLLLTLRYMNTPDSRHTLPYLHFIKDHFFETLTKA